MFIDDVKKDILIDELQLGSTLGESIHHSDRPQFSLLLAMLTDDVQAHSQFYLPKSEVHTSNNDENQLREFLKVPNGQSLSLSNRDEIESYNQVSLIENNSLADISLLNAVKPLPLAFRDDINYIPKEIIENTSLYCQKKHLLREGDNTIKHSRSSFKAQKWLNNVKECLTRYEEVVSL